MIKAFLQQAVRNIEAERDQKIAGLKDIVLREKIVPYNTEIDTYRTQAIAEIDKEFNIKLSELRKEFEEKKRQIIALAEEKKKTNMEEVYASELAVVTIEYEAHIAKLNSQISECSE